MRPRSCPPVCRSGGCGAVRCCPSESPVARIARASALAIGDRRAALRDDERSIIGVGAAFVASAASAKPLTFAPGAPGHGDPYFPLDGNGGYDVDYYRLQIRYSP